MFEASLTKRFVQGLTDGHLWSGEIEATTIVEAQEEAIEAAPVNYVFGMKNWQQIDTTTWRVLSSYWTDRKGRRLRYILQLVQPAY